MVALSFDIVRRGEGTEKAAAWQRVEAEMLLVVVEVWSIVDGWL